LGKISEKACKPVSVVSRNLRIQQTPYPGKQVDQAQEHGGYEVETENHLLEEQALERSDAAPEDGFGHRFVAHLDWRLPGIVARSLAGLQ
jgi:hypothetical protein